LITASPAKRNETPSRHFHARRLGPLKTAEHHRLKLAFDCRRTTADRNLRFRKSFGTAKIAGVRKDKVIRRIGLEALCRVAKGIGWTREPLNADELKQAALALEWPTMEFIKLPSGLMSYGTPAIVPVPQLWQ
jgi:hypothetical protein